MAGISRSVPVFLALLATTFCANDDAKTQAIDAAGDTVAATDVASGCPHSAQSCPSGCSVIEGRRSNGTCLESPQVLGCYTPGTFAVTSDVSCIKSVAAGDLFRLQSGSFATWLAEDAGWEECSADERGSVLVMQDC